MQLLDIYLGMFIYIRRYIIVACRSGLYMINQADCLSKCFGLKQFIVQHLAIYIVRNQEMRLSTSKRQLSGSPKEDSFENTN